MLRSSLSLAGGADRMKLARSVAVSGSVAGALSRFVHSNRAIKHHQIRAGQNRPKRTPIIKGPPLGPPISGPVMHMPVPEMSAAVCNWERESSRKVQLSPEVWNQELRVDLVHRVVTWQRAGYRQGTHKTKTRSEIAGSGKKKRPQKGQGMARIGDGKSPHFFGGGDAHPKLPTDYSYRLQGKVVQKALKIVLSSKFAEKNLLVLDTIDIDSHKTQNFAKILEQWDMGKVLFIHGDNENSPNLFLAARNIEGVNFLPQVGANVYSILKHDLLVITETGLKELEARLLARPKFAPKFVCAPTADAHLPLDLSNVVPSTMPVPRYTIAAPEKPVFAQQAEAEPAQQAQA